MPVDALVVAYSPGEILRIKCSELCVYRKMCGFNVYIAVCMFIISYGDLTNTNKIDIAQIWAVEGDKAEIPCNAAPRTENDRPILILWYKSNSSKPIYSYDARYSKYAAGERFPNKTIFGDRAYFVPMSAPAALVLNPVIPSDRGQYTCRLDYADSPTTSDRSSLHVIEIPDHPEVYFENERVIGAVRPVGENSTVQLFCTTRGGRPKPSVVWWIEGSKAPGQRIVRPMNKNETRAVVQIQATRELNLKKLSCIVQIKKMKNINLAPIAESVYLNITLPPVGIRIQGPDENIPEGTTLSLSCLSWGAYPSVVIKWWKSGKEMENLPVTVKDGGNITAKSLKIMVKRSDHGSSFTCRAANPELSAAPLVETKRLNVTYKPSVQIHAKIPTNFIRASFGVPGKPGSATVVAGSQIRFECSLNANPYPTVIEWQLNGVIIESGKNSWSYLIENVSKEHSGVYICIAVNSFGRGSSFPYTITVEHPPECRDGWNKRTRGVEIGTTITVLCRVDAIPAKDLTFTWAKALDDSTKLQFSSKMIQTDQLTSRLRVTVDSLSDLGLIMCKAKNSVGVQLTSCDTLLVAASPPTRPSNCSAEPGKSGYSVLISCIEGFDGGFPQKFVLVAKQGGEWIANETRTFPEWHLTDLMPKKVVQFKIQAFNAKGASEFSYIKVIPKLAAPMKDEATKLSEEEYTKRIAIPIIATAIGIGGALSLAALVIASCVCSKGNKKTNVVRTIYATPCPIKSKNNLFYETGKVSSKADKPMTSYMVVDTVPSLKSPEQVQQYENLILRGLQCSSESSSTNSKEASFGEEDVTDLRMSHRRHGSFGRQVLDRESSVTVMGGACQDERTYANCGSMRDDELCTESDGLLQVNDDTPTMGVIYVPSTNCRKMRENERRQCKYGIDSFRPAENHSLLNGSLKINDTDYVYDSSRNDGPGKLEELRKLLCVPNFQREGSVPGNDSSTYQKYDAICPYELAITPTLENVDSVMKQNFGSISRKKTGTKMENGQKLMNNSKNGRSHEKLASSEEQFIGGHIYERISPRKLKLSTFIEPPRVRADEITNLKLRNLTNLTGNKVGLHLELQNQFENDDNIDVVGYSTQNEEYATRGKWSKGDNAVVKCVPSPSFSMPTYHLAMVGESPQFIDNISPGRCNLERRELDKLFENCSAFSRSHALNEDKL